jgi:hypothetical protein
MAARRFCVNTDMALFMVSGVRQIIMELRIWEMNVLCRSNPLIPESPMFFFIQNSAFHIPNSRIPQLILKQGLGTTIRR